ncbi:MAG: DUF5791 family protein, partial [Halobacteriaceae archaeon]
MLRQEVDPTTQTPASLYASYVSALADIVKRNGVESVTEQADIAENRIEKLANGEDPSLTIEEATSLLALHSDQPDPETLRVEIRDDIMLGMSSAVLDVDS